MTERPPFPFIVGCARSGTTLLRLMLDTHPDMAVPPESYFAVELWPWRARYLTREGFDLARLSDDLLENPRFPHVREDWGIEAGLRERLVGREPIDYPDAIRLVYSLYAESRGTPRYGDKSPSFVLHLPLLGSLFPEARFLHLIRDGRDVASSLLEMDWGPDRLEDAATMWAEWVAQGRDGGRTIGPDRYLEVRYEELVDDPETVLKMVCEAIELHYRPEMLTYHRRGIEAIPVRDRPQHRSVTKPPTKGLRDWRRDLSEEEVARFESVAGDHLATFGYPTRSTRRTRPVRPVLTAPSTVIFVHIPKTGGATLRRILDRQYAEESILEIDGMRLTECVEALRNLDPGKQALLRVIRGHMEFGLHRFLEGPAAYVTILRDPVDRIISSYHHARREPRSSLHEEIVTRRLDLRGYVERCSRAPLFNNGQTRLLGTGILSEPQPATEQTLDRAKRNLERFAVVGLFERFDESILLMRRVLGWDRPSYFGEKVTPQRPPREEIDEEILSVIAERNNLDVKLHRFARALFEAQVREHGAEFRREVDRFRLGEGTIDGASRPALSAIVLAYRNRETVEEAVASLLGQEAGEPFEVVLVASGGDGSAEAVRRRFPSVKVVESPERLLPGAARNAGLESARGEVVAFLAADCIAEPGWIASRLRTHGAGHPVVASAVTNAGPGTPSSWAAHYLLFCTRLPQRPAGPVAYPDGAAHGASFHRSVLRRIGPFSGSIRSGEDSAALQRAGELGIEVWYEPAIRTAHRNPQRFADLVRDQFRRGVRRAWWDGTLWPEAGPLGVFARSIGFGYRRLGVKVRMAWQYASDERRQILLVLPLMAAGEAAWTAGWAYEQIALASKARRAGGPPPRMAPV